MFRSTEQIVDTWARERRSPTACSASWSTASSSGASSSRFRGGRGAHFSSAPASSSLQCFVTWKSQGVNLRHKPESSAGPGRHAGRLLRRGHDDSTWRRSFKQRTSLLNQGLYAVHHDRESTFIAALSLPRIARSGWDRDERAALCPSFAAVFVPFPQLCQRACRASPRCSRPRKSRAVGIRSRSWPRSRPLAGRGDEKGTGRRGACRLVLVFEHPLGVSVIGRDEADAAELCHALDDAAGTGPRFDHFDDCKDRRQYPRAMSGSRS